MKKFEGDVDNILQKLSNGGFGKITEGAVEAVLLASCAVSLKRIADTLDEFLKLAKNQS